MLHEQLFLERRVRAAVVFTAVMIVFGFEPRLERRAVCQTQVEKAVPPSGLELIASLQSDRYSDRQQAMFQILKSPGTTLRLLQERIESGDADFQFRTLKILEQVAIGHHSQAEFAFDALREISLSSNISLARKAQSKTYDVLLYRQYVVARKLERLNAHIEYSPVVDNEKYPLAEILTINADWRGSPNDLQQISSLFGLSDLELSHAQVTDKTLHRVDSIFALSRVKLKRCSITDKTIESLSRLSSLRQVEILYCPIGTKCFESLENFRGLTSIRLIGTKIDPACSDLLEQQLNAAVDIRRGAFLGVRYSPAKSVCRLTSIVPGSCAEQAGFRIDDEIIEFNKHSINEHRELTLHLRECSPGEKASVKLRRGNSVIEFSVEMGEWD